MFASRRSPRSLSNRGVRVGQSDRPALTPNLPLCAQTGVGGKVRAALTPGPSPALRAALTPSPSPALRVALTPGPSPALRERGDLGGGLGIVDRCQRRIAPAPLIPPSSPTAWARTGARGKGRAQSPPSSPTAWERRGQGGGEGATSPFLSRSAGEEGGWGEGEGDTHPLLTHKNEQNLCNILTKYLYHGILLTGW